jgi:4-amino-4-deoxy-L-arabinose transferase-like glycosyltransferase
MNSTIHQKNKESNINTMLVVGVLIFVQILLSSVYLKTVPRLYNDEPWEASIGYEMAERGMLRHGFIEGWGGMHVHFVQNQVLMPFVLAGIYKIAGFGIVSSRVGSVMMSVLAVASTFFVIRRLFGKTAALWAALGLIFYPWFFEISRRVRPEIYFLALGMTALWLLLIALEDKSRVKALLAGLFAGLAALTHPTGLVLVGVIFISAAIWFRSKGFWKIAVFAAGGFAFAILPYVLYILWAVQDPQVNFFEQMRGGKTVVKTAAVAMQSEVRRWQSLFQWPKGIPLAAIMLGGWAAAWYRSTKADKFAASVILFFAMAMPFSTVNTTGRYLIALSPFMVLLLVRLVMRIVSRVGQRNNKKLGIAAGALIVVVYVVISFAAIGILLVRLGGADFDRVIDKVAAVTGPEAKVYGEFILWMGKPVGKLNYGYYPLTCDWRQTLEMVKSEQYDYAVRSLHFGSSGGISRPAEVLPNWRDETMDILCRQYGTKVASFYDPYFGPFEIYKLNWE